MNRKASYHTLTLVLLVAVALPRESITLAAPSASMQTSLTTLSHPLITNATSPRSIFADPPDTAKQPEVIAADTISPSVVANLSANTDALAGAVDLSWIAPGDDGSAGTASVYIVRCNTTNITESNWGTSVDVTAEPTPGPAGRVESMTVTGLTPGQMYYFAIKAQDETPNTSGVSNSPRALAQTSPNVVYLPLVASSASGAPPVIPDTTNVLTQTTTQYLSSTSNDGAVFTFTQSTPALSALTTGEVIVGGVTTNAPYGFLRKVTSVSPVGGQVVVATTQATLEDAIDTGSAHISGALTSYQIQGMAQAKGVSLAAAPQSLGEFYLTLEDVVLFDADNNPHTVTDTITGTGTIKLEPGFDLSLSVRHSQLEEFSFTASAKETTEIEIKAGVEYPFIQSEKEIAQYRFAPITVMVGPVPVVIVPVLTVNVGVDGSVHVGITAGVGQEATLLAGLRCVGGVWQPVSSFSNQFYFDPPTLSAGLDVKGYAGAQLSLLLYGVTGPYAGLNAYLKLEADIANDPWWTLWGGLEVPVGVRVEVLGKTIVQTDTLAIGYRLALAHAQSNNPPNLPFSPLPADGAIIQDLNANLSWSGGDLDGDAVTYDVYFEPDDNTPDVLVSNDQMSIAYDPGTLSPSTHYYWRIVVQDAHGATTAGPVWSFSTATGATCPITLTLQSYQVNNMAVTISGTVNSACSAITRLNWQWGDGVSGDQWFPALHTYAISGTYPITATAHNSLGQSKATTTIAYVGVASPGMVYIPAGNFQMGCDPAHNGGQSCNSDELPLHTVYLDIFQIDKYEVTNAQYAQCVTAASCTAPSNTNSFTHSPYYGNATYANYPVMYVNWNQATAYCAWAGKRLPTEAEWKKAARGSSDTRAFPWGDAAPTCALANFSGCVGDTRPVGSYPAGASPYGALDMAGNIGEWVNDWYQADYYSFSPSNNPPGPTTGSYRVQAGGSSWYSYSQYLRIAYRDHSSPTNSAYLFGFRCAASP